MEGGSLSPLPSLKFSLSMIPLSGRLLTSVAVVSASFHHGFARVRVGCLIDLMNAFVYVGIQPNGTAFVNVLYRLGFAKEVGV